MQSLERVWKAFVAKPFLIAAMTRRAGSDIEDKRLFVVVADDVNAALVPVSRLLLSPSRVEATGIPVLPDTDKKLGAGAWAPAAALNGAALRYRFGRWGNLVTLHIMTRFICAALSCVSAGCAPTGEFPALFSCSPRASHRTYSIGMRDDVAQLRMKAEACRRLAELSEDVAAPDPFGSNGRTVGNSSRQRLQRKRSRGRQEVSEGGAHRHG
jgi:hypothetical protein